MAEVNPRINPTNDPSFGNNSRAIDTPDPIKVQGVQTNQIMPEGQKLGDRSAEYLGQAQAYETAADATSGKAWGDLFGNIVQMGDFLGKAGVQLVKKDIENRVYEIADQERQQYTAQLESMLSGKVSTKNIMDANASMDTPEVPDELGELPDELATLKAARGAGKITKLDYQGRLLEHAKALRAQYQSPELKKYIDDEFAKVTGQNPANAKINSLITTLNSQAAAANSTQNKMLAFIRQNKDVPRAEELYVGYLQGQYTDAEVFSHISRYSQAKEKITVKRLLAEEVNIDRTERAKRGQEAFDFAAATTVSGIADTMLARLGLDTPAKIQQMNDLEKAGAIPQARWNELNKQAADTIAVTRARMYQEGVKSGLHLKLGGTDKLNERIDANIKPLLDIQERITNKDFGGIGQAAREAKELIDDTQISLLKDSKAGPAMRILPVLKNLGGEQYLKDFNLKHALKKDGIPERFGTWFRNWEAELLTQGSRSTDGQTRTFNDMMNEMKSKGITEKREQASLVGSIVKRVGDIADPKTPDNLKINMIDSAFSTGNNRFLSRLEQDSTGKAGMHAVYQNWTAEGISKEVKRLDKLKPGVWKKYTDWAQSTFSDEIVPREIATLSKYAKDPNFRIDWDTENKRFNVTSTAIPALQARQRADQGGEAKNSAEIRANQDQLKVIEASINRINSAMYNLKGMAALEGGTDKTAADAFLLRSITNAAGTDAIKDVQSIPAHLMNQIMLGSAYGNRK